MNFTTKIIELIIGQKVPTNPDEIADGLNKYFNDIGTALAGNLPNGKIVLKRMSTLLKPHSKFKTFLYWKLKVKFRELKLPKLLDTIVYHPNF